MEVLSSQFVNLDGDTMTGALNVSNINTNNYGNLSIDDGTVFIDSSTDRIGIGTTTPNAKLDIVGEGGALLSVTRLTTGSTYFYINGSTGYVGIGTASPSRALDVEGDFMAVNLYPQGGIRFTNIADPSIYNANSGAGTNLKIYGGGADDSYLSLYSVSSSPASKYGTSDYINFHVGNTAGTAQIEAMRIVNGGNVGIGTTTPLAKLDVSNSTQGLIFNPTGGSGDSPIINTTGSTNVTITSSGGSVIIQLG